MLWKCICVFFCQGFKFSNTFYLAIWLYMNKSWIKFNTEMLASKIEEWQYRNAVLMFTNAKNDSLQNEMLTKFNIKTLAYLKSDSLGNPHCVFSSHLHHLLPWSDPRRSNSIQYRETRKWLIKTQNMLSEIIVLGKASGSLSTVQNVIRS